jgi:hypothetical protein
MDNLFKYLKLPEHVKPVFSVVVMILLWVLVPGIMLGVLFLSKRLSARVSDPQMKTSARAGWWAGMVLFVFFFIYQIPQMQIPDSLVVANINLSYLGAIIGAAIGFSLLLTLGALIESRAIGIITLLLSFSAASALCNYFLIRLHNDILLSGTLGIAFGSLLYVVIFPKHMHRLVGPQAANRANAYGAKGDAAD